MISTGLKLLLLAVGLAGGFYLYLYFDDQRMQQMTAQCEQLVPIIESLRQTYQYYPEPQLLSRHADPRQVQDCHYALAGKQYHLAVPGSALNFGLYIYVAEQHRWIDE